MKISATPNITGIRKQYATILTFFEFIFIR